MHSKDTAVSFSDREREVLERVAAERGVSVEEAADQLMHEAIAQRFKQRLGRMPAQVYTLKKR
jgi:predicted kinase